MTLPRNDRRIDSMNTSEQGEGEGELWNHVDEKQQQFLLCVLNSIEQRSI